MSKQLDDLATQVAASLAAESKATAELAALKASNADLSAQLAALQAQLAGQPAEDQAAADLTAQLKTSSDALTAAL